MPTRRRVAITGLGAVTPIGATADAFFQGLAAGRSGVRRITQFDPAAFDCRIAAEVTDFDPEAHFDRKNARKMERFVQFSLVAAREAWTHSGLDRDKLDLERVGCLMGVGIGGIGYTQESCRTLVERGPGKISPFLITKIISNMSPGYIAIDLGLKGPNLALTTACAAGTQAIGEAAEVIRRGAADVMLAGGAESAICEIAIAGFDSMRALASGGNDEPARASRPFDARRTGFVMGEGAGVLVLEDFERARARGAPILAELAGYGISSDAFHITAPSPGGEGAARAIREALAQAEMKPEDIGYINAHGTSTPLNDKLETEAVKSIFGDRAKETPMSSNKSMIGHLLGGAGGVEAVATVLTLVNQTIPPTINLENPDPECDLDYVPNVARKAGGLRAALSNSFGFGGHNGAIVISLDGAA
jgi:3-oxoacyl-[acyl-carrier-protein] synthase II